MAIMKIVQVINLSMLQVFGLCYGLSLLRHSIDRSLVIMTISTVLFYSLCVDLARD